MTAEVERQLSAVSGGLGEDHRFLGKHAFPPDSAMGGGDTPHASWRHAETLRVHTWMGMAQEEQAARPFRGHLAVRLLRGSGLRPRAGWNSRAQEVSALESLAKARPALPRSWVVFKSPLPNSHETLCMLTRQRELTLPRPTAAPTATSCA